MCGIGKASFRKMSCPAKSFQSLPFNASIYLSAYPPSAALVFFLFFCNFLLLFMVSCPLCFSQVRKFSSKDSAGLRVRSHPSLQSEQIGIVHVNGTITFIDEVIVTRQVRIMLCFCTWVCCLKGSPHSVSPLCISELKFCLKVFLCPLCLASNWYFCLKMTTSLP